MGNTIHTYDGYCERITMISKWRSHTKLPEKFIHYTSINGFHAMLKDYIEDGKRYVTLFPSQIQYLNDSQEYKEGLNIVKKRCKGPLNLNDNIFVTCFCGKEDLLSQWKYYGQNSGISIEFDFDKKEEYLCRFIWWDLEEYKTDEESAVTGIKKKELSDAFNLIPYPVFYKYHYTKFKKMCESLQDEYTDVTNDVKAGCFVPYCKNKAFTEENESRLIFYPMIKNNADKHYTNLKYRVTSEKYIPQFTCKVFYDPKTKTTRRIPIKNVMIGPGHNQLIVFNAIINMLEQDKNSVFFLDENSAERIKKSKKGEIIIPNFTLQSDRITYTTSDGITIQMSTTPFRP